MFNTLDLIFVGVFLLSSAVGAWRGLTKEALSLLSWIGSGVAAYLLLPVARHIAQQHIQNVMMADVVAAFVIFILFLIFFSLMSHILASYIQSSALGGIDRALGCGFGIARALILVCGFELALSAFMPRSQYPETFKQSLFMPMAQNGSEHMLSLMPPKIQDFVISQQQKFARDHADMTAHNPLHPNSSKETQNPANLASQAIDHMTAAIADGHDIQTHPPLESISPAKVMNTKEMTENLASLRLPKGENHSKASYGAEQQGDLNRLIETVGG